MSAATPLEQRLLAGCTKTITEVTGRDQGLRLELLESVAARIGGWDLNEFRSAFDEREYRLSHADLATPTTALLKQLVDTPIPPSIALATLAQPPLSIHEQRQTGAYYTDFRLASFVASHVLHEFDEGSSFLDPAAGTGVLLVAAALAAAGSNRRSLTSLIAERIHACDLSADALRGCRLALGSMTDQLGALTSLDKHLLLGDSLMRPETEWSTLAPEGFDLIVGNPPWERVKTTRHEVSLELGAERHYGADHNELDGHLDSALRSARDARRRYSADVAARFPRAASGELDLYKAFIELAASLVSAKGHVAFLVPAGLLRSAGAEPLRRHLVHRANYLSFTLLDNRERFFAIDSRFKFVVLHASFSAGQRQPISLRHATGTPTGTRLTGTVSIGRRTLEQLRPDLTIPEVRTPEEWRLFRRVSDHGVPFGAPAARWLPDLMREVDMTRSRKDFFRSPAPHRIPVVEGRMVQQHRVGAKGYVAGSGRRAQWVPFPPGQSKIQPQYCIELDSLTEGARDRVNQTRVGFCDIVGQTNERTVMTGMIPKGVVCGNKVPTITFARDEGRRAAWAWIAISNSFVFDWAARRVVTTTLNYFLLLSLPVPAFERRSISLLRLGRLAKRIHDLDTSGVSDLRRVARLRAEIDARVASLYGLHFSEMELILADFPLLDRGQPPLAGEARSSITRDLVLAECRRLAGIDAGAIRSRVTAAERAGAIGYVPSEFTDVPTGEHVSVVRS